MSNFRRLSLGLFALLVVAATLVFVLENQQPASLSLFGWTTPQLPISVFVALALISGLVVGPFWGCFSEEGRGHRGQDKTRILLAGVIWLRVGLHDSAIVKALTF